MRFMAKCVLVEYAQDNNDTSYISAAYTTANVALIMVWDHKLPCSVCLKSMQRTINMHVLRFAAVSASETQFNMTC